MRRKRITNKDKNVMSKWISKHGACEFDTNNSNILLGDGGLFSIEKKKRRARKVVGYKKLPNGMTEVLFSKTKPLWAEDYKAVLWMEELDGTINYLKSMKRLLNNLGIKTSPKG